ncbi:WXG100-like domain-containing protein, partial [Amycolatopsis oliviviridis]
MAGGSVKLPPELQKFFLVTLGMSWPEGNDVALSVLERAWREFEVAAGEYQDALRASGAGVDAALVGQTGEFFASYLGRDVVSGVEALGEASGSLAGMAKTAAADVVKAKVMMVAMAAMALATIVHLLATLIFAFMAGAAILTARAALMAVWRALVAKMRALAGLSLTKELGVQVAKGVGRALVPVAGFAAAGAGIMG